MKLIDIIIPDPSVFFLIAGDKHVFISKYYDINISFSSRISFASDGTKMETQSPTITYIVGVDNDNGQKLGKLFNKDYLGLTQTRQTVAYLGAYAFKAFVSAQPNLINPSSRVRLSHSGFDGKVKIELHLDGMGFDDFFSNIEKSYPQYEKIHSDFISRFELMDIE